MTISPKDITTFQKEILDWYAKNKRDLPWRHTSDPYKILVSEIMLQQTQVVRVIPKYNAWFLAFPTITALANAKTSEVLRLWSGLGYNRRALYLQNCAKKIVAEYNGIFPQSLEELKKLPGIGVYTSAAIVCFAFNQHVAVVDTNVKKVIVTRLQSMHGDMKLSDKELQAIADQLLPKGRSSEWNQALMDYASVMLKNEKIPLVKQSKFKDSNRYYRGKIIKLLLAKKRLTLPALAKECSIDKARLELIITGMVRDMLIKQGYSYISLIE